MEDRNPLHTETPCSMFMPLWLKDLNRPDNSKVKKHWLRHNPERRRTRSDINAFHNRIAKRRNK